MTHVFMKPGYLGLVIALFSLSISPSIAFAEKNQEAGIEGTATAIDLKNSEFTWRANKKIGSGHYGNIFLQSATAEIKDGKIQSAEFIMNMKSFTVTDLRGRMQRRFMNHVKSGDFFEVEKYPTARLVIEEQVDDTTVRGQLTIKEQTQPITIQFTQNEGIYQGTMTFDRTQFGITYNSENFVKVAADQIIQDEVTLEFKVALKAPKAAPKVAQEN